jgi:hypothetical protein
MISDQKLFVVVGLMMENFWLPQDWGPNFYGRHIHDDNFFAIVDFATIKISRLLILWRLDLFLLIIHNEGNPGVMNFDECN